MSRSIEVIVPEGLTDVLGERFRRAAPGVKLRVISVDVEGKCGASPAQAVALFRYFPNDRFAGKAFGSAALRRVLTSSPLLRWIQTNSSGVDGLLLPEVVESDIMLSSGASVNAGPVAESVLALLLAAAKRLPQHVRHQEKREWQRYRKLELCGSTIAVIGYGHIGQEVGRLCTAFGMKVLAVRRDPSRGGAHAAAIYGPESLCAVVAEADFVVLTAASTQSGAVHLGKDEIVAMKKSAWLINVARGSMVDTDALVNALRNGTLAGAILDVFETEPLSSESALWDVPNLIITPHNSASSPRQDERTIELFAENFRRWIAGEALLNVVDKRRGY